MGMMSKLKMTLPTLFLAGLFGGAVGAALTGTSALAERNEIARQEHISAVLLERGISALDENKIDTARPLWEQAIVANPRNAPAFSYLGLAAQRAGDKDNAKKYFDLALEIDPNELHALAWGGQTDLSDADLDGAQASCRSCRACAGPAAPNSSS